MSKRKKKVLENNARTGPVFLYTSVCCGARGTKPPVERSAADRAEGKFSESPLGSWRCSKCEEPCKVTRSRAKNPEDPKEKNGTGVERAEVRPE